MKKSIILALVLAMSGAIIVSQGCKKKSNSPEPQAPTPTYDQNIATIMNNYCFTCHSGSGPSAGLSLTTYDQVKAAGQTGKLLNRINSASAPMPPSGLIGADHRKQVEDWINAGYPEK